MREGWKLVPVKMTLAMRAASKRALKDYLDRLPEAERAKLPKRHGTRLGVDLKHDLRYEAAIAAAPAFSSRAVTETKP
jgi:hypothetical protein